MKRLVLLLLAALPAPAAAVCPAANQFNFLYSNQPAATLSYGGSYTYTAATSGGATRSFTAAIAQNGLSSSQVNSAQMPAISTLMTGADATKRSLVLGGTFSGRTATLSGTTRTVTVTFTFTQPIRDFAATLYDIDFSSNQYRDWIQVTGSSSTATYTPVLSSPAGNGNGTGVSRTASGSTVTFGPATSPVTLTNQQAAGSSTSDNNSSAGTINASFAQPVTSVTIRYGNAPYTGLENDTGQQAIGIAGISFCPMPDIGVVKTSTPASGALGAYDLPANDITYTLTVTNTGGSPVDAGTIVLRDVLPAAVTFRNTALAGGIPFAISSGNSGVTLSSTSPAYSNDGGTTWGYAPAAGYDPNVKAVRITPSGTMAPNSSFSVTFVAQVK
ncbi:hypothetical protein [Sphingomonas sp.]|jgi:uncharacterized repeat protein (TIGR01451 family)|uniref:hypothetical protein n=1 Tax=Sphingomonas sp. TaxID=28214 RepID=UPI002D7E190C|nr:hypothetical protein [Sphingomonas sp.]HEU0045669.1 hypothetical protein [Sphingomonas sp.]